MCTSNVPIHFNTLMYYLLLGLTRRQFFWVVLFSRFLVWWGIRRQSRQASLHSSRACLIRWWAWSPRQKRALVAAFQGLLHFPARVACFPFRVCVPGRRVYCFPPSPFVPRSNCFVLAHLANTKRTVDTNVDMLKHTTCTYLHTYQLVLLKGREKSSFHPQAKWETSGRRNAYF